MPRPQRLGQHCHTTNSDSKVLSTVRFWFQSCEHMKSVYESYWSMLVNQGLPITRMQGPPTQQWVLYLQFQGIQLRILKHAAGQGPKSSIQCGLMITGKNRFSRNCASELLAWRESFYGFTLCHSIHFFVPSDNTFAAMPLIRPWVFLKKSRL